MRGYNALGLPALDTQGPNIVGAFAKGRELQNLATRNALMTEELRGIPAKRTREEERWQHEKGGWEMEKKTKLLQFDRDATAYVRESLATIRPDEYPQFLQNLKDKGLDTHRFPEGFDSPEEFEAFRKKAIETAREREIQLEAKLRGEEAAKDRTFKTEESEKEREFKAGESKLERENRLATAPLYETDEGYQSREGAIGKKKWRDPRDLKLTEAEKFKIQMLQKEGEGLVKTIQNYRIKKVDEVTGKPLVTPGQASAAVQRLKGIQSEVETIVNQVKPTGATNALTVSPQSGQTQPPAIATGPEAAPVAPSIPQQPAAQAQSRTAGNRVSRLVAIHQTLKAQGKDPMADPKVKAATEAFLASYPEARADFERTMGAGGVGLETTIQEPSATVESGTVSADQRGSMQPAEGQNLTIGEFAQVVAKNGWSPERAAKEAASIKLMDAGGHPIDFESFKTFFRAAKGAHDWTDAYLKNAFQTYVNALSSVGNAMLDVRVPGTSGMRKNALNGAR